MPIPLRLALCAFLFASVTVTAQSTWVVDAAGGPGAQFTDIQPAVDAASDRDRILVRAGTYSGFTIDGKGLAVLGETGVSLAGSLVRVRNTAPHQAVVLADLRDVSGLVVFGGMIENCAGPVLLERVTGTQWTFVDAADVRLNACSVAVYTRVTRCRVTISDSRLAAGPFLPGIVPALSLDDSEVMLARSGVSGQNQFLRVMASPAVGVAASAVLTLTDDGSHVIGAGQSSLGGVSAIVGAGTVIRDPRVQVLGTGGAPGVAVGNDRIEHVPTLQALGAPVGSTVEVDLAGLPGEAWVLVFGLPVPPFRLPGIRGELGLGLPLVTDLGVFGASAVHRSIVAAPGLPPGIRLCWQALATDGPGVYVLSNHATYTRPR